MAECFIGEVRMFGGAFTPVHWAQCFGQLLPISQNQALFSLLGASFGGDGRSSFGLPDMRGRIPVGAGDGPGLTPRGLGQRFGTETVTLDFGQMPPHAHRMMGTTASALETSPTGNMLGTVDAGDTLYEPQAELDKLVAAPAGTIESTGDGQAHQNMMPSLGVTFIVALQGIYPQRN
ncbi:MAG: phage tail protein [Gammaproteobacteria bacterium]